MSLDTSVEKVGQGRDCVFRYICGEYELVYFRRLVRVETVSLDTSVENTS